MICRPPLFTLFPYTTLFRSRQDYPDYEILFAVTGETDQALPLIRRVMAEFPATRIRTANEGQGLVRFAGDRKSTRLNSSHGSISYAVFCLKKKTIILKTVK